MGAVRNPHLSINRGIVGDWLMNEGSGNIFDLSGNGHTGTLNGNVGWGTGKFGSALNFPGAAGDYVTSGYHNQLRLVSGTMICWFKTSASDDNNIISLFYDVSNRTRLLMVSTGVLQAYSKIGGSTISFFQGTIDYQDDIWHQVALTWGSDKAAIYVDGLLVASENGDERLNWAVSPRIELGYYSPSGYEWDGLIDSPMFFNRASSASEIALLYREPFCGFRWPNIVQLAAYVAAGAGSPILQMDHFGGGMVA